MERRRVEGEKVFGEKEKGDLWERTERRGGMVTRRRAANRCE